MKQITYGMLAGLTGKEDWKDVTLAEDVAGFQNPPPEILKGIMRDIYYPLVIMSSVDIELGEWWE